MDWSQQVQVYVSWVNSQLRKSQRLPLIRQLQDPVMKDGTVMGLLVELISGHTVPGLNACPISQDDRLANINALLAFMQSHKVKMHAIEAEAVVNGDLKSIMRIVLALAAHFKPRSVRPNTVAAIMQGAAVSLANTKHQVLRSPSIAEKRFEFGARTPSFEPRGRLPSCHDAEELEEADEERPKFPQSIPLTPRAHMIVATPSDTPSVTEADSGCHVTPSSLTTLGLSSSEEILAELSETRSMLEQLQHLLLTVVSTDSGPSDCSGDGPSLEQAPGVERRLSDMQAQLRMKEERLFANELQLGRAASRCESVSQEADQLRAQLAEKNALVAAQQKQIDHLQRHVANVSADLEATVVERFRLSRELAQAACDKTRQSSLEKMSYMTQGAADQERSAIFDESMERLRSSLAANDPQHHLLDQLEHCFHSHRHPAASAPLLPPRSIAARRAASRPSTLEIDKSKDKRQPITALQGFPIQRLDQPLQEDEKTTRLLYYTDKTVSPFVVTICKRSDEICLNDIRRATGHHDRPFGPRFRFLFKTHDPDFGAIVKEEIRHDGTPVPTWEDKIVAWILESPHPPP